MVMKRVYVDGEVHGYYVVDPQELTKDQLVHALDYLLEKSADNLMARIDGSFATFRFNHRVKLEESD